MGQQADEAALCLVVFDLTASLQATRSTGLNLISFLCSITYIFGENDMRALVLIIVCLFGSTANAQQLREITNSIGMKLVLIHAGSFTMGSPEEEEGRQDNEKPLEVTISKSYYFGVYEVTQEEYQKVTGNNPSQFKSPKSPVVNVSWDDALSFCSRLLEMPGEKAAGREYRLPTEAEWEYACRATSTTAFCSGNVAVTLEDFAWFGESPVSESHTVGVKRANRWGLYDMHGNVCEWYLERYDVSPNGTDARRKEQTRGWAHVMRGGCCNFESTSCSSASRLITTKLEAGNVGFRVAMSLPAKKAESVPSK